MDLQKDLVELLRSVPHLLDACVQGKTAALRTLRLISKEVSNVALLALRSFKLTLKGEANDTDVSGAGVLSHTCLKKLSVHLAVSGTFGPASLMESFLLKVGSALRTVTRLELHVDVTEGNTITPALLSESLVLLVGQCPSLKHLHSHGNMSTAFMHTLGQSCPLISSMSVIAGDTDLPYLIQLLLLQPVCFPNINSISFPGLELALPDMSGNSSILTLKIKNYEMASNPIFSNMPPNLQHLSFASWQRKPRQAGGIQRMLYGLRDLKLRDSDTPLDALADLLLAAPALQEITVTCRQDPYLLINCSAEPSIAAGLAVLKQRVGIEGIKNALFFFNPTVIEMGMGSMPSFIASLPRMSGFTRLEVADLKENELVPFLNMFPDVQKLSFQLSEHMDDIGLQALEICVQMTHLKFLACQRLTSVGLFALCQSLPGLKVVTCDQCDGLMKPALAICMQLLRMKGFDVKMTIIDSD